MVLAFFSNAIGLSDSIIKNDLRSVQVHFYKGDFQTFLVKAEMQRELVFLIASADNCFPCEHMEEEVNKNQKLIKYLNKNFVSYKYQRDESTDSYLEERYKLHQYPAVLFLDSHGNVIAKLVGKRKPCEIYRFAKKIKKRMQKG